MSDEEPVQAEYAAMMKDVARAIDGFFNGAGPKRVGFALLTFSLDNKPGDRVNYMSNCERADMLNAMKEFIARAEGRISDTENLQ